MWDSVVIGQGSKGNSAVHVYSIEGNHSICENRVAYWIGDLYIGLGMTVFKDTEVGARLTQMIQNKESLAQIRAFLEGVLLQNISPDKLTAAINTAVANAFESGRRAKAAEMRSALGL